MSEDISRFPKHVQKEIRRAERARVAFKKNNGGRDVMEVIGEMLHGHRHEVLKALREIRELR